MIERYASPPITTVPNSLQEQLDRVQNLLDQSAYAQAQGQHVLAANKAREVLGVLQQLAHSAPDRAFLLLAAQMGYQGYEIETVENVDRYQVVENRFFGIAWGTSVVNVPTTTRRIVRGRLF